jgi:hypothetical protein
MPRVIEAPPSSPADPMTDVLHGVSIEDPYRWLEEQDSLRTRQWLEAQTGYARTYLDAIPGRAKIRERVRECLAVETYDSVQRAGNRYFFRKRLPHEEQASIYMREGPEGEDQLLIHPSQLGSGPFTSVKPLYVSTDLRLLLIGIKVGGERMARFVLLDIERRVVSTSWSIRADVVRKLDRGEPQPEVNASGTASSNEAGGTAEAAPFSLLETIGPRSSLDRIGEAVTRSSYSCVQRSDLAMPVDYLFGSRSVLRQQAI